MALRRVGILTGGGDCSGLNAVIRAVTRTSIIQQGAEVVGIQDGFEGLVFNRTMPLTTKNTRDVLTLGGTILGTTNKGDPFAFKELVDGEIRITDYSERCLENYRALDLDCLFVVGGDGTLELAYKLHKMGMTAVGVPKTIDNDIVGTDYTFGFQTAVEVACDAMDRLHTTGRSHQRVMILEVMGRDAGWIALEAGIAGGAHIILIPEIPYSIEYVCEKIRLRAEGGSPYSIVIVAEGARSMGGTQIVQKTATTRLQSKPQLGGISATLARQIRLHIDLEVRTTVLGHIQRGGSPCAFDRVLGTRLGAAAVAAAARGETGTMVALRTPDIVVVPLDELAGITKSVPVDHQLVRAAEAIGINLGREAM